MFTKFDVLKTIINEHKLINHLAEKITTKEQLEYRPTVGQRSTHELLAYITRMSMTLTTMMQKKEMDPETLGKMKEESEAKNMLTDFTQAMDAQLAMVTEYINSVPDAELKEEFDLFKMGKPMMAKSYFMMVLQQYPAYRMQLFQYLKSGLGMTKLNTMNVWMGADTPKK